MTLRFYATGIFQREDGDMANISESATCRIVHNVTRVICSFKHLFLSLPNEESLSRYKRSFFDVAGFPGMCEGSFYSLIDYECSLFLSYRGDWSN